MQVETEYLSYSGCSLMIGYVVVNNQGVILNIVEGVQQFTALRYYKIPENRGLRNVSLDTFKTGLTDKSSPKEKEAAKTSIFLTGSFDPNKLYFLQVNHAKDFKRSAELGLPTVKESSAEESIT